eukprot:TRINITY_DN14332_c0_g2_i1.p2 TRINITY_DN14332_c0_g2~~TRINITY_DN14332_c0_g2_i1.p2  ORF type:complete len:569 (+),score=225.43 TRINITY_DN14332_c0_g2_i1:1501-3207(+)
MAMPLKPGHRWATGPGGRSGLHGDTHRLFGFAAASKAVDLGRAWLLAWLLGPAGYGLWQTVGLALTWAGQLHLGTVNALSRELPMALALGDRERQDLLRSQTALTVLALAVLVGAFSLVQGLRPDGTQAWVWLLAGPLFVLNAYYLFSLEVLEGCRRFSLAARGQFLASALLLVLALALAPWLGVAGVVAACLLQRAAVVWYWQQRGKVLAGPLWPDWAELKRLITAGGWFWLATLSAAAYLTVDRLLVLGLLGGYALGLYALAWAATSPLRIWIASLETAARPRILALVSGTGTDDTETPPAGRRFLRLAWAFPWFQGMAFILLPLAIGWVLPRYAAAIPAAQLAALGAYFLLAGSGAASYLLGRNQGRALLRNSLYTAGVSLVLSLGALALGAGIAGVTAAAAAADLFRSWHLLALGQRSVPGGKMPPRRMLGLRLLPWLVMLGCLAAGQGLASLAAPNWSAPAALGLRAALFSAAYATLALYFWARGNAGQHEAWFPLNAVQEQARRLRPAGCPGLSPRPGGRPLRAAGRISQSPRPPQRPRTYPDWPAGPCSGRRSPPPAGRGT